MQKNAAVFSSVPSPQIEEKHFPFGQNWRRFLAVLNDDRIAEAEKSLREMIGLENLKGKRFLDVGAGSGLFSLAARRLGAQVISFDYDADSVGCTQELRRRFFPKDSSDEWRIEQASVLDNEYLESSGTFDIVYAWGVLHHTGDMWRALDNVIGSVASGGLLFISIYNDQGWRSKVNKKMKQFYNASPKFGKTGMALGYATLYACKGLGVDTLKKKNPLLRYREKTKSRRGMSIWYDIVDWLGGYPYEVATPEALFDFYHDRGFELEKMKLTRRHGCNEFVFLRRR